MELGKELRIYYNSTIATQRKHKRDLKFVEKFFLDFLERNKINNQIPELKEEIHKLRMDQPSSSKIPTGIEEIQEENINEETAESQEEITSTESSRNASGITRTSKTRREKQIIRFYSTAKCP
ncbi:hypothetical protein O181_004377 [Austropuccinia psidii MF-1]|uniref:Uncharacterized protein n=1 Tax=Austropuccinia psidii MF-1 TaxID=1389203 RepID=A0A9Q3BG44_9BASI|nr:hypothetical protein [Austropuccinia psidii MF-1]